MSYTGCPDLDITNSDMLDMDLCDVAHDVKKPEPPKPIEKRQPKPKEVPSQKEEKKEPKVEVKKEDPAPKQFMGMDMNTAIISGILVIAGITVLTVWGLKKITTIRPVVIKP